MRARSLCILLCAGCLASPPPADVAPAADDPVEIPLPDPSPVDDGCAAEVFSVRETGHSQFEVDGSMYAWFGLPSLDEAPTTMRATAPLVSVTDQGERRTFGPEGRAMELAWIEPHGEVARRWTYTYDDDDLLVALDYQGAPDEPPATFRSADRDESGRVVGGTTEGRTPSPTSGTAVAWSRSGPTGTARASGGACGAWSGRRTAAR